jgi:hypothetical protein
MTPGSPPSPPARPAVPAGPEAKKLTGAALGKFYTPGLQDELVTRVRSGSTRGEAAKRSKIAPRSFGYWMAKGRANLAEVAETEEKEPGSGDRLLDDFGMFVLEVEAAEAQYEKSLASVVEKKAASGDKDAWKAAGWLLERRFRQRWGRSGGGGGGGRDELDGDDSSEHNEPATVAQGMTMELRTLAETEVLGVPRGGR